MKDELQVLQTVVDRLEKAGIAYMVSGSMAMNYYAQPRLTRDIDIVVELSITDVKKLTELFANDFYVDDEMIRNAIAQQGMFNMIHNDFVFKVDFIIRKDTLYRKEEFSRRFPVEIAGFRVWVVTAEDLILSKLVWGKVSHSEMQLNDVRNLIATVAGLKVDYISHWASELSITDLWESVWPH